MTATATQLTGHADAFTGVIVIDSPADWQDTDFIAIDGTIRPLIIDAEPAREDDSPAEWLARDIIPALVESGWALTSATYTLSGEAGGWTITVQA